MDGARALMRDGVPSIVSDSLRLKNLSYTYKQNQYQHHVADIEYGLYRQGIRSLSRRLTVSLKPLPYLHTLSKLYRQCQRRRTVNR
jgi:hypothetical protein